jgi:nucleoside-diphosphate-sugar epimerase
LGHPQSIGQSFQITSDFLINWNQIYEQMGEALGVKPNIVHIPSDFIYDYDANIGAGIIGDKMWSVIFDNTKIKTFVPEYAATIPFHTGIRRTLSWFQADPARLQVPPEDHALIDNLLNAYQNR